MTFSAKFAIVFLCAAVCALSVSLIPRERNGPNDQPRPGLPVILREKQTATWLLV
jgi:hypothetical protein